MGSDLHFARIASSLDSCLVPSSPLTCGDWNTGVCVLDGAFDCDVEGPLGLD